MSAVATTITPCLFFILGVFLISVKPLTTEITENKTTPKFCKITVILSSKLLEKGTLLSKNINAVFCQTEKNNIIAFMLALYVVESVETRSIMSASVSLSPWRS